MPPPPRTLILVRHAKSSWADDRLPDHDRPLNDRGIRDAPHMARRFAERGPRPQAIISSSAKRALATATAFANQIGLGQDELTVEPAIYGAGLHDMIGIIREIDDGLEHVLLVGHNPTFSDLAACLSGANLGNLPTCAVVTLGWNGGSWGEAAEGLFVLQDLDYPKKQVSRANGDQAAPDRPSQSTKETP